MTLSQFETWSMILCGGGLIVFMFFIVWDLAKKSQAGKLGTLVLFGVLGLALLLFIFKELAVYFFS
jgi:Na+/melibiose symporter-like transporter